MIKKKYKILWQELIKGLKLGWNIPLLPEKLYIIYNHPIRITSNFIGIICIVTVFINKHLLLPLVFKYILLALALIECIDIFNKSILELKYGFKTLVEYNFYIESYFFSYITKYASMLFYLIKLGYSAYLLSLSSLLYFTIINSLLEMINLNEAFTLLLGVILYCIILLINSKI